MKYTTAALALGFASVAIADESGWEAWTSTTTTKKVVDPAKTSSTTWEDWSASTTTTKKVWDPKKATTDTWADWSSTTTTKKVWDPKKSSSSEEWSEWSSTNKVDPAKTSTWADWSASTKVDAATPSCTITKTVSSPTTTATVTHSTLFLAAGEVKTVSACDPKATTEAWEAWTWSQAATTGCSSTITKTVTDYTSTVIAYSKTVTIPAGTVTVCAATTAAPVNTWTAATTAAPGGWTQTNGWGPAGTNLVSVIGTGADVWTWTVKPATETALHPAPTYAGWSDWNGDKGDGSSDGWNGPAPGTDLSNVTAPMKPLPENSCNTAADRSKWCGGQSINTDWMSQPYDTGRRCEYDFTITNTTLDFDGSKRLAFAINGQVPGPLIECNWGDTISVRVTNKLQNNATTIHWHGIIQHGTNDQDGVPGVTECGIAPGQSRVYEFKANQYGTGWYHSHALSQYGDGIRGPMIIHGPASANYDYDMGTVMIDDLFNNTAAAQNDFIAHVGPAGTSNYILNGHNTKPDLSAGKHALWSVKQGKKHLFRLINSASQNMWAVHFDNHKMTVIATDYVPIKPYTTEWLNIGIGQRYDVIVEMNQPVAGYFLRAVTQLGCPSTCDNTGLGNANGIFLYEGAAPTLPTSTAGGKTLADFGYCLDEPIGSIYPYVPKTAGTLSAFQASASTIGAGQVTKIGTPSGPVFQWWLNNAALYINYTQPTLKSLAQGVSLNSTLYANNIVLNKTNEWYYFVIQNQFLASHPMHLHGHDMSLLGQGQGVFDASQINTLRFDNPVRRDTVQLMGAAGGQQSAGYTVIGFQSDNPGAWLMHCHIIWHVDGGLALQWIERPKDIDNYAGKSDFQGECSAATSYFSNPANRIPIGSSGLKRRDTYFDKLVNAHANVVRHAESAERRYIDSYVRRGLGDGYKPRHGARR